MYVAHVAVVKNTKNAVAGSNRTRSYFGVGL